MGLGATPTLVVIAIAVGIAVLVWVPTAIVLLRRRGRLAWGPALLSLVTLLYACVVIVATLLPTGVCYPSFTARLVPGTFVVDVLESGGVALSNAALRQTLLTVLLFVPFGMLVRRPARPGLLATTLLGAGLAMLLEVTQLTGTVGLAACQYRLADVDDVLLSAVGAFVGALAAPLVWRLPGQRDARLPSLPRPLTTTRRLGAMAIDVGISIGVGGAVLVLGIGGVGLFVAVGSGAEREAPVALVTAIAVVVGSSGAIAAAIVHLLVVLRTGRTIGELVGFLDTRVQLAPTDAAGSVDAEHGSADVAGAYGERPEAFDRWRRGGRFGADRSSGDRFGDAEGVGALDRSDGGAPRRSWGSRRSQVDGGRGEPLAIGSAWEADSTAERAAREESARASDPVPGVGRRVARWASGIGGWTLLSGLALDPVLQSLAAVWALAAIVLAFRSRAHSGLALRLTRQLARDVRDPR